MWLRPQPVKFLVALLYKLDTVAAACQEALERQYGTTELESETYPFEHTDYYQDEMGRDLKKKFICLAGLHPIDCFVEFKRACLALEARWAVAGKRRINLDPAYLELSKLVVATTKNFDHRVYLAEGIYADVQLRYRHGAFVSNPWTYPDYRSPAVLDFLQRVRRRYAQQLSEQP